MFNKSIDDRLSLWAEHRRAIDVSDEPLVETWEFWKHTPFIPFNKNIDPFNHKSWPTPWDIIVHNKYDDFTKALMIAWSLKYTNKFKEAKIEIKTIVNDTKTCYYNVVCVDNKWAINYSDNGPIPITDIPESFFIENQVEVKDTW
jgi:hypothetical protein